MRRIYLVRHGMPEKGTSEKVYIGVTDLPLSMRGSAEACELGRYFLQRLSTTSAVRILSSPLQRCRQTAEELYHVFSDGGIALSEPLVVEALHEIDLGEWEGKSVREIRERFPEEYEARGRALGMYHTPGGESFLEAGVRFQKAIEAILKSVDRSEMAADGKQSSCMGSDGNESSCVGEIDARSSDADEEEILLVVAHAGVIRAYLSLLMGRDLDHLMDLPLPYASVTELEVCRKAVDSEGLRPPEKPGVGDDEKTDREQGGEDVDITTCREEICVVPDGIGVRPEELLDAAEITRLYQKYQTPEQVIRHMRKVAEVADRLMDVVEMCGSELRTSESMQIEDPGIWRMDVGEKPAVSGTHTYVDALEKTATMRQLNRARVMKACLLHDLCRAEKQHARVSAEVIRKEGYPAIAALVAVHHQAAYSEQEAQGPLTEAELLFYADKRVQEDRLVSVEERFRESRKKCRSPEACAHHDAMLAKTLKIEKKIIKETGDEV